MVGTLYTDWDNTKSFLYNITNIAYRNSLELWFSSTSFLAIPVALSNAPCLPDFNQEITYFSALLNRRGLNLTTRGLPQALCWGVGKQQGSNPQPAPHQFKHWMTDKFQYSSKFQVQIYVFVAPAPSSLYVRLWKTRSHSLHAMIWYAPWTPSEQLPKLLWQPPKTSHIPTLPGNYFSNLCAVHHLRRQILIKIRSSSLNACLQTWQWGVKIRHFCHPEKLICIKLIKYVSVRFDMKL